MNYLTDDMNVDSLIDTIGREFELDDEVTDRIEFSYHTYSDTGRKKQCFLQDEDVFSLFYFL